MIHNNVRLSQANKGQGDNNVSINASYYGHNARLRSYYSRAVT